MQRPPQLPSILSSRQAYQWISRIHRKLTEVAALDLPAEESARLREQLADRFVAATLRLQGEGELAEATTAATRLHKALGLVEELAHKDGRNAGLSVDLLKQLHEPAGKAALRTREVGGAAPRAEHLPVILENACRWFSMASIAELNPVEQAALALLRLVELSPFDEANEPTAIVAASLFLLRGGLPPLIIEGEALTRGYRDALAESLRMDTQPMVELVALATERTLDAILQFAAKQKSV